MPLLLEREIKVPMVLTAGIELTPTPLCPAAPTPGLQILLDTHQSPTFPTEYRQLRPLLQRPNLPLMGREAIVATNTGEELVAASVLDGDDIPG